MRKHEQEIDSLQFRNDQVCFFILKNICDLHLQIGVVHLLQNMIETVLFDELFALYYLFLAFQKS